MVAPLKTLLLSSTESSSKTLRYCLRADTRHLRGFAPMDAVNTDRADALAGHINGDGVCRESYLPRAGHEWRVVDQIALFGGRGPLGLFERAPGTVERAAVEFNQPKRLAQGVDDRDGHRPAVAFGLGTRRTQRRFRPLRAELITVLQRRRTGVNSGFYVPQS
jgi:hypothetical protein